MIAAGVALLASTDGVAAAPGDHLWSQRFGNADENNGGRSIATDPGGNLLLTGGLYGSVDYGGGALTSAGRSDIFLAKFTPAGNHLWSKRFGDANDDQTRSVAVDGSGNTFLTGYFDTSIDFGGGTLASAGASDAFLVKFDPAGNHVWSKRFGDANHQRGTSVAVDSTGNVFLTGYFGGSVNFGGGTLVSALPYDAFLAKFDSAGHHLWSKNFGDTTDVPGLSVAVDAGDNVVLTGNFSGSVDFGGGTLWSMSLGDVFLAKFDSAGNHLWSKGFAGVADQFVQSVAVDADDYMLLTGAFNGSVDFGGGVLMSAGGRDIFLAKFDPAGDHLWSKRFGDANDHQYGTSVAADGAGNVHLTGYFELGSVDFGGGALTSAGSLDIFLAKFDPAGNHLSSTRFGDADGQAALSLALDASDNVVLTGSFGGSVDFGGGPLTNTGPEDAFLVKFAGAATELPTSTPTHTATTGVVEEPTATPLPLGGAGAYPDVAGKRGVPLAALPAAAAVALLLCGLAWRLRATRASLRN